MNSIVRGWCFLLLASVISAGHAQTYENDPPKTPAGKLARAAGAYLGANEVTFVFKRTECGYALQRDVHTFDEVAYSEIIPWFPPSERSEIIQSLPVLKRDANAQAHVLIHRSFLQVNGNRQLDSNTACGLVAGILGGVRQQAYANWLRERELFHNQNR